MPQQGRDTTAPPSPDPGSEVSLRSRGRRRSSAHTSRRCFEESMRRPRSSPSPAQAKPEQGFLPKVPNNYSQNRPPTSHHHARRSPLATIPCRSQLCTTRPRAPPLHRGATGTSPASTQSAASKPPTADFIAAHTAEKLATTLFAGAAAPANGSHGDRRPTSSHHRARETGQPCLAAACHHRRHDAAAAQKPRSGPAGPRPPPPPRQATACHRRHMPHLSVVLMCGDPAYHCML
jgi:hypothetical protein